MASTPLIRELLAELRDAGGVPVRTRGSHQQWRLPGGSQVTVPVNHRSANASPVVEKSVRAAIAEEARGAK